ncbi:Replication factor C subunit 5 [Phytophthora cinnamomi]|uniref:Replication factor C subunit 5 n=1 Tax=Phytophthora cinnamomi TaxID=4785 RepID=UPI00355A7371|nr:Replication factor C subunit 5 [Phytophthora cinnamomi]
MATPKPTKSPISSTKVFKTICVLALKKYSFRISNKAIRHLRLTMNTTIAPTVHLPEALEVIFASLAERCKRRIDLEDIREWISAPGPSAEADDEAEWSAEDDLSKKPLYDVRKVLERKRLNRKTYYLVDWEST